MQKGANYHKLLISKYQLGIFTWNLNHCLISCFLSNVFSLAKWTKIFNRFHSNHSIAKMSRFLAWANFCASQLLHLYKPKAKKDFKKVETWLIAWSPFCLFQIFDNKSDLLVHSQTVHKTDPKPYRCPTCQKCFANSSYLSQHARIHAGIKPYKCQICERRFTQLCHLQQHIRTHTGEKPYKCQHPTCGKAFSQLSNLQSHSRSHMTDKPYRCNSCYKCFTDEQGLRDHIPKHSETKHLKTFICRICGKSYTQETYLARHMTKHQGVDPAANMLNLTSLRHQQTQPIQQQQPQSAGTGNQLQQTSTASGMSPLPSPNSVTGSMSATGGGQQQPHHQQGNGTHQQHHRTVNSTGQDLPDIKPFLENNGSDFNLDPNKPSAFMPLPHQFSSPNMMNTSVPSNFPFPSPRLPSTTLNSGLSRLSPPANSAYFPLSERVMPNLSPESMIANSLLRLQQIRDFSHSTHPVFPKSEPGSPHHKEFAHKEYSHKDYT